MAGKKGRPRHGSKPSNRKRNRRRQKRHARLVRYQAKRLRRRLRAARRSKAWKARPWWEQVPGELAMLERDFPPEYANFTRDRIGDALVYRGLVELELLGIQRKVIIIFRGRPSVFRPIVMADGPRRSRHRFYWSRPSSLCLWYAPDPDSMRWTLKDGLAGLIDLARLHLVKESWWRATNEWPGREVHRQPPAGDELKPLPPRQRSRATLLRRQRQRCWCGAGRYNRCHGAIPVEEELVILGLT